MKYTVLFGLLILARTSYSQDEWASWDQNYPVTSYTELISAETHYADSVEKNPEIIQYFCRFGKYKITAHYLGQKRPIDDHVLQSMLRVYKLTVGNWPFTGHFDEYLFDVEGAHVWMPMQPQLEKPFKKEIKKQKEVTLYCAFFNEHSISKGLYNTLLISEFQRQ